MRLFDEDNITFDGNRDLPNFFFLLLPEDLDLEVCLKKAKTNIIGGWVLAQCFKIIP